METLPGVNEHVLIVYICYEFDASSFTSFSLSCGPQHPNMDQLEKKIQELSIETTHKTSGITGFVRSQSEDKDESHQAVASQGIKEMPNFYKFDAPLTDQELESQYGKGLKLLKKLGWSGTGGIGDQGIETPLVVSYGGTSSPVPSWTSTCLSDIIGDSHSNAPKCEETKPVANKIPIFRTIFNNNDVHKFIDQIEWKEMREVYLRNLPEMLANNFREVMVTGGEIDLSEITDNAYVILTSPTSRDYLSKLTGKDGFPHKEGLKSKYCEEDIAELLDSLEKGANREDALKKRRRFKLLLLVNYPTLAIRYIGGGKASLECRSPHGVFYKANPPRITGKYSRFIGNMENNNVTGEWLNIQFTTRVDCLDQRTGLTLDTMTGRSRETFMKENHRFYQYHPGGDFTDIMRM